MMTRILSKVGGMAVVVLAAMIAGQQSASMVMANDAIGLGNILGGVGGQVGALSNNLLGANGVGGIMSTATNMVGGVTRPVMGMLGSLTGGQSGPLGVLGSLTGGQTGPLGLLQNPGNSLAITSGLLGGLTSGAQAAANIGTGNQVDAAAAGLAAARMAEQQSIAGAAGYGAAGALLRNNFKREAIPSGSMAAQEAVAAGVGAAAGLAGGLAGGLGAGLGSGVGVGGAMMAAGAANAAAAASEGIASTMSYGNPDIAAAGLNAASAGVQAAAIDEVATGGVGGLGAVGAGHLLGSMRGASMMSGLAASQNSLELGANAATAAAAAAGLGDQFGAGAMGAGGGLGAVSGLGHLANAANTAAVAAQHVANAAHAANVANVVSNAAATETALVGAHQVANHVIGRQALATDALGNAQAEAAIAGADMAAHGAINARSASLAGNAYRQAKLASARDRVNIAGTIQNSARISDAAIATHDAATKAEDSLLGSELAVDSAATVLDSDAAYIPPVTNSLLRSLPYGRLGVRNIIPKPLTYPSVLLPDVWLNGAPVNYMNVPLRMLPYGVGSTLGTNQLWQNGAALANGGLINGQPFIANNGRYLNGMVIDPAYSYLLATGAGAYGLAGSSVIPILANGQVEAQDEVALANMVNIQQLNGAGMSATYQGYGRNNPVPMITGSVNDATLMPTTTIGTTYPIGSALVIEPRDSYFQDYVDNASSRQNFDERQQ